jgi:hypothetical protein
MTEKQLLQQLKGLKNITLSEEVKKSNRNILFSQIANTSVREEIPAQGSFFWSFKNIFSVFSQPLLIVAGVFVFIAGGLIVGSGFFKDSKPNDSLYIARIISERAKLNTTFSQTERDALSLKFASDHAKDIATILMDPEFNTEENKDQVEKLNASFKNEISKVKDQMEKNSISNTEINLENNNEDVFSASSLIEENGVEIYIEGDDNSSSEIIEDNFEKIEEINTSSPEEVSQNSSSSEVEVDIKSLESEIDNNSEEISTLKNGSEIIAEIEKLFSEGRYTEVVEKLSEVKSSFEK